ncbi:unnamed protein product, partial [Laminaria digitata]
MAGVTDLLGIFGQERYMLAYTGSSGGGDGGSSDGGEGSAIEPGLSDSKKKKRKKSGSSGVASVILHKDATGADTVKSLLALEYFQDELREAGFDVVGAPPPPSSSQSLSPATKSDDDRQQRVNGNNPAVVVNGDSGVGVGVAREGVVVEGWAEEGTPTESAVVASTEGATVAE